MTHCLGPRGRGRLEPPPPSGIRPPADPLYYFEISIFGDEKFLIYSYSKGGARAKKTQVFWSKFSKKSPKTPFLAGFSKFCLLRRRFDQNTVFLVLW